MKLPKAANMVKDDIHETLEYMYFPPEHWLRIRTNNPLERIMKEIKRRTKVVGNFPGWKFCSYVIGGPTQAYHGNKMEYKEIFEYGLA